MKQTIHRESSELHAWIIKHFLSSSQLRIEKASITMNIRDNKVNNEAEPQCGAGSIHRIICTMKLILIVSSLVTVIGIIIIIITTVLLIYSTYISSFLNEASQTFLFYDASFSFHSFFFCQQFNSAARDRLG